MRLFKLETDDGTCLTKQSNDSIDEDSPPVQTTLGNTEETEEAAEDDHLQYYEYF